MTSLSTWLRRTLQALLQPPEHPPYASEFFADDGEVRRPDVAETQGDFEIRVELAAGPQSDADVVPIGVIGSWRTAIVAFGHVGRDGTTARLTCEVSPKRSSAGKRSVTA